MDIQSIQSILGIVTSSITIIGLPFLIYTMWVKGQQVDSEKIVANEKIDITLANKFDLVALELKHLTEAITLIKQNDLHSIYEKQRDQDDQINKLTNAVTALTTIIDERVPRKTVQKVV
ncbi:MAG: hypothetical protein [Siphoviridae sp. cttb18]|nr:MAG: hypothetical protein [Siphoviridae sp. cttb18]